MGELVDKLRIKLILNHMIIFHNFPFSAISENGMFYDEMTSSYLKKKVHVGPTVFKNLEGVRVNAEVLPGMLRFVKT